MHHIDPYRLPAGKIASLIDFEAPDCCGAVSGVKFVTSKGVSRIPQRMGVPFPAVNQAIASVQAIWRDVCLVEWPERLGDQLANEVRKNRKQFRAPCSEPVGEAEAQENPPRLEVAFEGFGPQVLGNALRGFSVLSPQSCKLLRYAAVMLRYAGFTPKLGADCARLRGGL